jgi:hypothetical protein
MTTISINVPSIATEMFFITISFTTTCLGPYGPSSGGTYIDNHYYSSLPDFARFRFRLLGVYRIVGVGVGVLLAADSQSTSSPGYRASLWDPWPDVILLFFFVWQLLENSSTHHIATRGPAENTFPLLLFMSDCLATSSLYRLAARSNVS